MENGIKLSPHRGAYSESIDANTYFQWLQRACAARDAGVDVIASLLSIGVPDADAEAIALGFGLPDDTHSAPPVATGVVSEGLSDHGFTERRISMHRHARAPSRVRSRRRLAIGAALIVLTAGSAFALLHRKVESPSATPAKLARPGQVSPVTKGNSPDASHQRGHTTLPQVSAPHSAAATHARSTSRRMASKQMDIAYPPDAPSPVPMNSARPESCPPGVDRLGCPGAHGNAAREAPCPNGFRRSGQSCDPVAIPLHAREVATGFGWECNSGYIQTGRTCTKLRVPPNAHVDFTGRSWECDPGFERASESCRPS